MDEGSSLEAKGNTAWGLEAQNTSARGASPVEPQASFLSFGK